jgi:molybdopterin molybdotransferase
MITAARAWEALNLLAESRKMECEEVSLALSAGRVLGAGVRAIQDLPAYDNSAMDGYALRVADAERLGRVLPILKRVIAGDSPSGVSGVGAVEIMTGAPIPAGGFDAIIKVEEVEPIFEQGRASILLSRIPEVGEHVRKAGADFRAGEPTGKVGSRIDAAALMAFAALGIHRIPVRRKPRIRLMSTGNELQDPGSGPLLSGNIWNATGIYLETSLRDFGASVEYLGIAGDETEGRSRCFERELRRAIEDGVDMLVTTGAVSMGIHDFIPRTVAELGGRIVFHKVAIRPGKPLLVAEFPGKSPLILFGIPGNPVSSAVSLEFFLRPYLRSLLGLESPVGHWGVLAADQEKPEGLRCYLRAKWGQEERERVRALSGQASFMIHSLLEADLWIELPESGSRIPAGTRVRIHPLEGRSL